MKVLLALSLCVCMSAQQQPTTDARPAERTRDTEDLPEALLRTCSVAADRGLDWLAAQQLESGAWTGIVGHKQGNDYLELDNALPVEAQRKGGHGHVGVTALCGMAFLAGGHLPDRGPRGPVVGRTIEFLTSATQDTGLITDTGTRMYSHAFATLFLAEACGMVQDRDVKDSLQRAVNLIVDSQNTYGGWRYNAFDSQIDLSVTVCQLQALRAARNIGIEIPRQTIDRAVDYIRRSHVDHGGGSGFGRGRGGRFGGYDTGNRGQFYYKIHGRGAYQKPDEYAINAAALTALCSAGVYDKALHEPTLEFLEREYPNVAAWHQRHYFFWYGNYYACQAFFQAGGTRFGTYYRRLCADLLQGQGKDGRWNNDCGPGDAFSTAVACLLLQLPRQYLPIFQR